MEFFKIIDVKTDENEIQKRIGLSSLGEFVTSIFVLETQSEERARIGGVWGEFTLKRDRIKGGVRFYLIECPNALTWTITTGYPPERDKIVLHLTINRTEKERKFLDEIDDFIEEWADGIFNNFNSAERK